MWCNLGQHWIADFAVRICLVFFLLQSLSLDLCTTSDTNAWISLHFHFPVSVSGAFVTQ